MIRRLAHVVLSDEYTLCASDIVAALSELHKGCANPLTTAVPNMQTECNHCRNPWVGQAHAIGAATADASARLL